MTDSAHSATSAGEQMPTSVVDLFAGPGGWSQGAKALGIRDIGIEWDDAACDTRVAAGHLTIRADVAEYPTEPFVGKTWGLIASPPCTLFSSAGTGVGNLVIATLARGITDMLRGSDTRDQVREDMYPVTLAYAEAKNAKRPPEKRWTQERVEEKARSDAYTAALVIEPARFAAACDPEWVALEQVPEVLPLWQTYARELRRLGYRTWAGILNAADYGVAQTRERAFLLAHLSRPVLPPEPTHAADPHADMFGDDRVPWITMAAALGWGMTARPSVTVTAGSGRQGGPAPLDGGSGARETLRREQREGRWAWERPATTVVGSSCPDVIAAPGYRTTTSRQNAEGSHKVTLAEAGVLQSFPADYPWQGSKSKQFEQVGNAVPPLLAAHVLSSVTGLPMASEVAA